MTRATATIQTARYLTVIDAGGHHIVADEPPDNGGADKGPAPYDLLLSALCACTAITLRMYADRKGWPLTKLKVDLGFHRDAERNERIERVLHLEGDLTAEQRARIADIAERTPVTLTLKRGISIATKLADQSPSKF